MVRKGETSVAKFKAYTILSEIRRKSRLRSCRAFFPIFFEILREILRQPNRVIDVTYIFAILNCTLRIYIAIFKCIIN